MTHTFIFYQAIILESEWINRTKREYWNHIHLELLFIQWIKVNIEKFDRYKKESFYNFVRFIFFYISPFVECYAFQNNSKLLKCWISICRIWNALTLLHLNFMIIKMFLQIIMVAKILWITLGINQITMSLLFYSVVLIQITFVISLFASVP